MIPSLPWLPAELQAMIIPHLTYPDLLALKLSHPHYYYNISTTVHDRVAWLIKRQRDGRTTALASKCVLQTDAEFLRNEEVRRILKDEWKSSNSFWKSGWKWSWGSTWRKRGGKCCGHGCSWFTAMESVLIALAGVLMVAVSLNQAR